MLSRFTTALALTALALGGVSAASASPAAAASIPSQVVFSDSMSRTQTGGLGDADQGGGYTVSDPRVFSVAGGVARANISTPGASVSAEPSDVKLTDATQSVTFVVPQLPRQGRGVYLSLQARKGASAYYQLQVLVDPRGTTLIEIQRLAKGQQQSLVRKAGVVRVVPGSKISATFRVDGDRSVDLGGSIVVGGVSTSVTAVDSAAFRIVDAGRVAVRAYLSSSTPAQSFTFDDYRVTSRDGVVSPPAPAPTPTPSPTPTKAPTPTPTVTATPTPMPTATPTPTAPAGPAPVDGASPAPTWDQSGTRTSRGSATVGTTTYAVPAGAIVVDSRAAAGGSGSVQSPLRTIQSAVDRAAAGATIVVRGGTYTENVTVSAGKRLTVQSYPGEAVWLDGATQVTGWKASGGAWYVDGWTAEFDASPTFTKGAPDGTASGWRWLNDAHPMAAHPDQVWIGGVALTQVATRHSVGAGTFFVDTANDRLYVGSSPDAGTVTASTTSKALSIRAEGTIVRGIGIRDYATSVWMMGAVTVEAPNVTLENVVIYDNATSGVFVGAPGATLRHVTVARNGLMGVGANYADGLTFDDVLSVENNAEHFNQAPVSGGVKITKSRGVTITDSSLLRNDGPAIWTDQSVYDLTVAHNDLVGNLGHGAFLELSQRIDFVDNLVSGNRSNALKINNTGDVQVWNNTIIGGDRTVNIVQDPRSADDPSVPGHDPRRPQPDPDMPWVIRDITLGNNVIAASSGNCTLCVEDYSHRYAASALNIRSDGNVIQRLTSSQPTWLVVWSRGADNVNPFVFTTMDAYRSTTGQDTHSVAVDGRDVTGPTGRLLLGVAAGVAQVLPPRAAALWDAPASVGALFP